MKPQAKYITPVVIGLIRRSDGKYLMTDRLPGEPDDDVNVAKGDFWQFPGGQIEVGETVEESLKRELREEVGVDVEVVTLLPKVVTSMRKKWQGILLYYLCAPKVEPVQVKLNFESSRYGWFLPAEIIKLRSFTETKDIVDLAENILK